MTPAQSRWLLLAVASTLGCTPNAAGMGTGSGANVGDGGESEGVDGADAGANDTGPGGSGGPSGSDDDGAGSDGAPDNDTAGAECNGEVFELMWAADAAVEPPMQLDVASAAEGQPSVAKSEIAEAGQITFEVEIPCAGDYGIYGLLWDVYPADLGGADSFHIGVGGAQEFVWRYGCQTVDEEYSLSWQALQRLEGEPCDVTPIVVEFPAPGTYAISLRNREEGSGPVAAGISALLVTSDLAADPYDAYEPYPQ
ncbi:MAG: hypothetical protein K0V04_31040 [Deltaproteobacteria bacterium]|nr:hypothetical protein [Deltaproteobacteria bacterium]